MSRTVEPHPAESILKQRFGVRVLGGAPSLARWTHAPTRWIEVLPLGALVEALLSMAVAAIELPPTFTTRTARASGLHPRDLYRMQDEGELLELPRGVFR